MITKGRITISLFLFVLIACNSVKDKKNTDLKLINIEKRVLYPNTVLSPLFNSIRPPMETFTIEGNKDTMVVTNNGTILTLPQNTFINSQGKTPDTLVINFVEIKSIEETILANLQTTSGDNILQTGGMFFIDANENRKPLALAECKSIFIDMKTKNKYFKMKLFDGQFDVNGKIDWNPFDELEKSIIPIPLSLIHFDQCNFESSLSKKQIEYFLNPKFENTYISTREFEDRCCALIPATYTWMNGLDQKLIDIYANNTDKPLFYADSLIVNYLKSNYRTLIETKDKSSSSDVLWISYMFEFFTELKNEQLGNTINFDKLKITEKTTSKELISQGSSESEAEKIIAFFKIREQIIQSRKSEKQTVQLASYTFSINKLGWVNVDRFIKEEKTNVSDFLVKIDSKDTLDYISVSLAIPSYNSAVFSTQNDGNLFSFTKKEDGYRKLPIGQDAIIVAFSYKDNKPYFGKKRIKIPTDGTIILTIDESSEQIIKQDIEKLSE